MLEHDAYTVVLREGAAMTETRATHEGMGERVRARRGELAYSQRDLQRESGVSGDVIVKLEHDSRSFRPSTIRRVAEALGVSAEWLTTGRDPAGARQAPGATGGGRRVEVRVSGEPGEASRAAARELERMFEEWMDEDEAARERGEPDQWPEIARHLDEDRASYRKLFEHQ